MVRMIRFEGACPCGQDLHAFRVGFIDGPTEPQDMDPEECGRCGRLVPMGLQVEAEAAA